MPFLALFLVSWHTLSTKWTGLQAWKVGDGKFGTYNDADASNQGELTKLCRLFILEGILTVLIACSAFFLLPDDPASCSFLTDREKAIVVHRLRYDTGTTHGSVDAQQPFKWKYVWSALLDYKVWTVVVVYWGSAIPIYG